MFVINQPFFSFCFNSFNVSGIETCLDFRIQNLFSSELKQAESYSFMFMFFSLKIDCFCEHCTLKCHEQTNWTEFISSKDQVCFRLPRVQTQYSKPICIYICLHLCYNLNCTNCFHNIVKHGIALLCNLNYVRIY